MRFNYLLLISFMVLLLTSCGGRTRFYDDDIEREPSLVTIERFDRDIFSLDSASLAEKYGDFMNVYAFGVLRLHSTGELPLFTSDSGIVQLNADVQRIYDSHSDIEKRVDNAFKYFHHYFPDKDVPRVLFHISGFNQSIVAADGFLSASIDQYLGADYEPYNSIAYGYEIPFMTREQLPVDMMNGWLTASFPESLTGDRLLDQMLFQGKIIYLLKVFYPDATSWSLLSFTESQYKWCERYEKEVWGYIMENRELFSTDWKTATKYLSPAPFTSGLSQESPGRIGVYIGFKIVESYMNANADATLQTLMDFTDSQRFLQEARYRP